jgi:hypothetical protein
MAAIGDILVKFVADFADFSTNMAKSQKEIESWSQSIAKAGQSIEGFIALAKRVTGALAIGEAIKQVIDYNDQMQKAGEALAAYSLRTDAASRSVRGLTDDSVKLAELYKTMGREWTEDYLARVQKAETASEDFSNKTFVLGQRMHDLYLQLTQRPGDGSGAMDWASKEANALFDWFEKLVPSVNRVVDVLANGLVIQLKTTAEGMRLVIAATIDLVGWLGKVAAQATVSGAELEKMGRAQAAQYGYKTGPAGGGPTGAGGAFGMFDGTSNAVTAAEAARRYQENQRQMGRGFGSTLGVPISLAAADNPPLPAGGGGGGTQEDTIDKQIARYKAMGDAADAAFKKINEGYTQNIEDLKRQVAAQQQADDIAAKLIARGQQVSEEQKKAIYDAVLAYETKHAAELKLIEVETAAVETDKKYGDGTVALTKLHKDLSDQLATHRISQTDFNRALAEGTEAINQAALAAQRYDDNLGSLAAGFEHAANAYARSNDLYSQGEQIFTGLTTSMTDGLKALEGQSTKTFSQILLDFANMLAEMAIKAAASQAFKLLFAGAGGVTPNLAVGAGGFTGTAGINAANIAAGLPSIPGLAGGGPVMPGQAYVVGEQGPEMFVPSAAGNIVPNGGGQSGGVTVNVDMSGNSGPQNDPRNTAEFARRIKAAVVDTISNEKRPGGVLYTRQSA